MISLAIQSMISQERFYAEVILQCARHYTDRVPTAGVNVQGGRLNLYINPSFWQSLNLNEQVAILKHECLHIMNSHIARRPDLKDHKVWNYATDAAINEFLPLLETKLSNGLEAVTVKRLRSDFPDIQDRQHSEYYYALLKQKIAEMKAKGKGEPGEFGDSIDDHSVWNDTDCSPEAAKQVVKKALQDAVARAAGQVPSEARLAIDKLNKPTVDWRAHVRRFCSNATESVKRQSRTTRNRRYGITIPGFRRKPTSHIAVAFDSSGSVSDREFAQFFAEVHAIHKLGGIKITLIEADCEVHKVYEYDPKHPPQRNSAGGTAYQPAIDKAVELGVDGLIYFGDGDCADTPKQPRLPFLWALTTDRRPCDWGALVRVQASE